MDTVSPAGSARVDRAPAAGKKRPGIHLSTTFITVYVLTALSVAAIIACLTGVQVYQTVSYSTAVDRQSREIVTAFDGLMDADQAIHRYLLYQSPTARSNYRAGNRSMTAGMSTIAAFARERRIPTVSAPADRLMRTYRAWQATTANPVLYGKDRPGAAQMARGDRLIDQAQGLFPRLADALTASAQAQRDDMARRLVIAGVLFFLTVGTMAASRILMDRQRRRDDAANVRILEERASALERSNAALQEFAYVASHDLQEPLRMVSSYTQLLGRRYHGRLDADADDFIGFAVDGAKRMQTLIEDILSYSRVNTAGHELVPVDAARAYEDALTNLQGSIESSGATVSSTPLPRVIGDESQLVQLFQNIIGNAVKYRSEAAPEIHVSSARQGNFWKITVRDNGIGIAPDYHDRIFRMFQRLHAKAEYGGTGIGLALCKRIVERHGGSMSVESRAGAGSAFSFTLRAA